MVRNTDSQNIAASEGPRDALPMPPLVLPLAGGATDDEQRRVVRVLSRLAATADWLPGQAAMCAPAVPVQAMPAKAVPGQAVPAPDCRPGVPPPGQDFERILQELARG